MVLRVRLGLNDSSDAPEAPFRKATTGIEPVDRSNGVVEPDSEEAGEGEGQADDEDDRDDGRGG